MSELRQPPLRKRRIKSRLRDATSPEEKLKAIRALYMIVYNSDESLIPLTTELFHTLGAILEGVKPEDLPLNQVNKHVLLETINSL